MAWPETNDMEQKWMPDRTADATLVSCSYGMPSEDLR